MKQIVRVKWLPGHLRTRDGYLQRLVLVARMGDLKFNWIGGRLLKLARLLRGFHCTQPAGLSRPARITQRMAVARIEGE